MLVSFSKAGAKKSRRACAGMTLAEILIAILILVMIMGGIIEGYVQANRMATFSSMSLAAQSTASQGIEQAIAARWDTQANGNSTGVGTADELGVTNDWVPPGTNQLDIPVSGAAIPVTNYITITQVSTNPPVRQIVSRAVWTFPLTGTTYTNSAVTLRAADQ
jgi:Tfp pilus assembly protein PilV